MLTMRLTSRPLGTARITLRDVTQEEQLIAAQAAWRRLFPGRLPVLTDPQDGQNLFLTANNMTDNVVHGHTMNRKDRNHTRVIGFNINGIKLDHAGGDMTAVCRMVRETQTDVLGITEHCLDTSKHRVTQQCHSVVKEYNPSNRLTLSSSSIESQHNYKAGGTFMMSRGNIVSRYSDSGADKLGRWAFQTYTGKNGRTLTIIIAYQVCKTTILPGSTTAAAQQESLLRQRGLKKPNPRTHFRKDLAKLLTKFKKRKDEILMLGDWNEALGDEEDGMSKICSDYNLTDIMTHVHGPMTVATYARGQKRLDYPLGSPGVLEAVRFCGYEPFFYRMFSDHRMYYIDFDTLVLFGSDTPDLAPIAYRDIQSKCPKQVTLYLRNLDRHLTHRNIYNRMDIIDSSDHTVHDQASNIDEDMSKFCKLSAKRCRKFREPDWSEELIQARNKVAILVRVLSIRRTRLNVHGQIATIQAETGNDFLLPTTIKQCRKDLRTAQAQVRKIARESFDTRIKEMENRILMLEMGANKSDKAKAKILKHIRKAEELRKMFLKLGNLRNGKAKGTMSRLEVPVDPAENPKTCKNWRTVDLPEEIVEYILQRNVAHFGQARGPWTEPPLCEEVDFTASTITTELILDGEYDASQLNEITQLMIKHMKREEEPQEPLSLYISDDDLIFKLKNWKEKTTTSPDNLHLGHWKALTARHEFSDKKESDECIELDAIQVKIRRVRIQLINYALRWGYSYPRWKNIVNVCIMKDPGVNKIHRIRVLHIYEPEYNAMLGIKWRKLMHHAADKGRLNNGQYGRHGRSPMEPVFIEEMESEISRASRKSLVKFDNDATSCYDRILVAIASIISRKHGLHKNVAMVMAKTLEEAKYRLKTELGISEDFYQNCELTPIYGTGQGSQNSPAIWCLISSVLFDCFETKAHGAVFESPDRTQSLTVYMIGFVDDSTGQTNSFLDDVQPPANFIVEKMKQDAQLWNDLLWTSGGALELPKCSYHVSHYDFAMNGAPVLKGGQVGTAMVLINGDGLDTQTIPSLSAYKAHETLGHWKEPAGSQIKQRDKLTTKSNAAGTFVQCSPLNRDEAWTYYFAIYLTSVGYVLPNCFFTRKALGKIQQRAIRALFAKCGFNRNTKKAILYGPSRLGGGNFRHLYTVQGVGQITTFLKSWRSASQGGRLLRIAVAWTQYAVGTSKSFLMDVTTTLPHMEVKYLKSLRDYLKRIKGQIETDTDGVQHIQREYDFHIMDVIIASKRFTPSQIVLLNYCRMYLQALTISDVTHADGITLDYAKLYGYQHPVTSTSTTNHHFNQGRPDDKVWKLWFDANLIWSRDGESLNQPLGSWLVPAPQQRQKSPAYYNNSDQCLYLPTPDNQFQKVSMTGELQPADDGIQVVAVLPPAALPTRIDANKQWIEPVTLPHLFRAPSGPLPGTFQEFISQKAEWESELFHTLDMQLDPFRLMEGLLNLPFSCTSDGSVRYKTQGSFGWALSFDDGSKPVHCSGPVYGTRPTSYRAEGYGLLSMTRFLICLSEYCNNTQQMQPFRMASDNISLVDNATEYQQEDTDIPSFTDEPLEYQKAAQFTLVSDWDILNEIRMSLPLLLGKPRILWVKGHQDRKKAYEELPLLAQLNVDADKYAGEFQDQHGADRPLVPRMPHNGAQLHLSGGTITYKLAPFVRYADTAPELKEYIMERNNWTPATMATVDWEAHGNALQRGIHKRVRLTKLVHDLLPTNHVVCRFIEDRTARCPTCQHPDEDRDHMLRCSHPANKRWRKDCLISLRKTMDTLITRPYLQTIFMDGLSAWFEGKTITADVYPDRYKRLIHQQTAIGWRQIFNGRMSVEWAFLQDEFLAETKQASKTSSGTLWMTSMLTAIWAQFDIIWKIRNGVVHGHDEVSRERVRRARAEFQLRHIYSKRMEYLPGDRKFLFNTIEAHLTRKTSTILNWVTIYEPLFKDSIRKLKLNAVRGVSELTNYFPVVPNGAEQDD